MSLVTIIRRIHLWMGVILGVQVLLWMASGVVMSFFHIDLVRGERNAPIEARPELDTTAYASPGGVIAQSGGAYSVELRYFLGQPVYAVDGLEEKAIYDARTGEPLSPLTEAQVRAAARNAFIGDGEIDALRLIDNPSNEYRGPGPRPVWLAEFDDKLHTRIYISPETGEIIRRRNDIWRIYDFFWMLHIMDYVDRDNFNNPLLKVASAAGLLFALSGLIMIFFKQSRTLLVRDVKKLTGRKS